MEEEVGLRAEVMEPLVSFFTTPGFCDEQIHVFRASGLTEVPPRPEADERIEPRAFDLAEAVTMIRGGEIREGKTLIALLLESERRRGTPGS
jgi:ADP-ribose diphosphatase